MALEASSNSLALLALFGALVLFWISTRQFPTLWRFAIWAAGAALLMCSGALLVQQRDHFGLFNVLGDAWRQREDFQNSILLQAAKRNSLSVGQFFPQLLDFFVILAAALAALALAAFTRGEKLERGLRPAILFVWGGMLGSALTLTIVAIGFGGQVKREIYLGYVTADDVHDGDTFWMGDVSFRIWGIDAPEINQACRGNAECSTDARDHLARIMQNNVVQCEQRRSPTGRNVESFGRPLVDCSILRDSTRVSVGQQMIDDGYAVRYKGDSQYYRAAHENFRLGCTLRPDVWRSRRSADRAARAAFESGGPLPTGTMIGSCS